jgi:hypothetical protein
MRGLIYVKEGGLQNRPLSNQAAAVKTEGKSLKGLTIHIGQSNKIDNLCEEIRTTTHKKGKYFYIFAEIKSVNLETGSKWWKESWGKSQHEELAIRECFEKMGIEIHQFDDDIKYIATNLINQWCDKVYLYEEQTWK